MYFIYNILISITGSFLKLIALFNTKIKLFVNGRKNVFEQLKSEIQSSDKIIWFHTASLGEFEQGLPVIEQTKNEYPNYKILVTFFSPSGYEVKKSSEAAHIITYLPLDTRKNAKKFLEIVRPSLAVFIKYEFWPNYLNELKKRNINTLLISAIFRENQSFFKPWGSFMRKSLASFNHFFVQDTNSKNLLEKIGVKNVTVSGDTRFDRVSEILDRDNKLDFIENFIQDNVCVVAGSTWPEDEKQIVHYINNLSRDEKYIIAPHHIDGIRIENLKNSISKKVILYSEIENKNLEDYDVFILNTIGILTKVYSYAHIAYVGGGMGKTGLHNTLEPAVFSIPVIIGKEYANFKEAIDLVNSGGIITIKDQKSFNNILSKLLTNKQLRDDIGLINRHYTTKNKGAKIQIGYQIRKLL